MVDQKPKRPADMNKLAKSIVDIATGEAEDDTRTISEKRRDAGIVGGKSRAKVLDSKQKIDIAKSGAKKRWSDKP